MGSRWEEHPTGQEERGPERFGAGRSSLGLEESELDLLRGAPDYDAEEMATVHPLGGWPGPAPEASPDEPAPASGWMPPNRVEPPATRAVPAPESPARAPVFQEAAPATVGRGTRFPEERTVALMAEDLLGRPLDGPGLEAEVPPSAARGSGRARNGSTTGADVWDSAMPLLVEG
jgi:hypothetical protein